MFTLHRDLDKAYYIYPSWAHFSGGWNNVCKAVQNPYASGLLDGNDRRSLESGDVFSPTFEVLELVDGPVGGGIIVAPHAIDPNEPQLIARGGRWIGEAVLMKLAVMRKPSGLSRVHNVVAVSYLQPPDDPYLRSLSLEKAQRLYVCSGTLEHVESSHEVFWCVVYRKAASPLKGMNEVTDWARPFNLGVKKISVLPEGMDKEVAPWFVNPSLEKQWFTVSTKNKSAGHQLAVMYYIALHWRWVAGIRLKDMHLVSFIEGRPRSRETWHPRFL